MASIANYPGVNTAASLGSENQSTAGAEKTTGEDALANKEVFIQLLVAQLQNQNPMSPSDPIQFLTQLAQFTSLEQSLAMRKELESIRAGVDVLATATTAPAEAPAEAGGESSVPEV